MPRTKAKRPVPRNKRSDEAIALRFEVLSAMIGITRSAFLSELGITSHQLYNYETLRTPIPCDVALRACRQFIVNENWLATGTLPASPCVDLVSDSFFLKVDCRAPFSQVFNTPAMTQRYAELWSIGPAAILRSILEKIKYEAGGDAKSNFLAERRLEHMLQCFIRCAPGVSARVHLVKALCKTAMEHVQD